MNPLWSDLDLFSQTSVQHVLTTDDIYDDMTLCNAQTLNMHTQMRARATHTHAHAHAHAHTDTRARARTHARTHAIFWGGRRPGGETQLSLDSIRT